MRKLACALFWLLLSSRQALSGEVPPTFQIQEAPTPYPAWVAAERVLTPAGAVDPSLFSAADRSIISGYLRLPPREGCIRLGQEKATEEIAGPQGAVRQSLASTLKSAGWVFSAMVTARAPGFNGSEPGTLLEVVPQEAFKGPRERDGAHYVFVPVGTLTVGGKRICKTDERYADLPEVGERVLLFVDLSWVNQGRLLWVGGDSGIVTIDKQGEVSLPRRYLKTDSRFAGGKEEDLVRFIRSAAEEK